jgi:preprotein translocase subunit SecG
MENTNLDKITAGIMSNSGLEITDPHFSSRIMLKITQKKKQQLVFRYILICSLLIIAVSVVLILLLRPGQSANLVLPSAFDSFSSSVILNITSAGNWIMGILVFIIPVVVLLLLKNLIDSRFKQPETQYK